MSDTNAQRGHARVSPARIVQNGIRAVEANIDGALAEGGALLAQMMHVSRIGKLSPEHGQKAIDAAIACLAAVAESRARAVEAHEGLRDAVARIDLREMGWGDLDDSPKVAVLPRPALSVVRRD